MKRMNVIVDHEALEHARRLTGKKSYSETINHAIEQIVKRDRLKKAIQELANDPNPWWPGYVEEMAPDIAEYEKNLQKQQEQQKQQKQQKQRRRAALTVRAPRESKPRGSR
jgi:hypothetical protein